MFIDNVIWSQREITSLVIQTCSYNNRAYSSEKDVFLKGCFSPSFNFYFQIVLDLVSVIKVI